MFSPTFTAFLRCGVYGTFAYIVFALSVQIARQGETPPRPGPDCDPDAVQIVYRVEGGQLVPEAVLPVACP